MPVPGHMGNAERTGDIGVIGVLHEILLIMLIINA